MQKLLLRGDKVNDLTLSILEGVTLISIFKFPAGVNNTNKPAE